MTDSARLALNLVIQGMKDSILGVSRVRPMLKTSSPKSSGIIKISSTL